MKRNYTLKKVMALALFAFLSFQFTKAQVRIVEVDPSTDRVKFKNFGGSSVDISSYRLCALFNYAGSAPLSSMTLLSGNLNLGPNAEVEITSAVDLNETASDFCLYLGSGSFGSPSAMVDFVQWGNGGQGRESVAVSKGIWTAGTFLQVVPPYEYIGDGTQNGTAFWETLLSVEDFETNDFKVFPNPTKEHLTLEFTRGISNVNLEVYNLLGRQVLVATINTEFNTIDVSDWASGMYLLKISSNGNTNVQRFIKQ